MTEEERFARKKKFNEMKQKVVWKAEDVVDWCKRNKEYVIVIVPIVLKGSIELVKIVTRKHERKETKELKDCYIYDRRAGHYNKARRPLKSWEWMEYDRRYQQGESGCRILDDMGLLD